MKFSKHYQVYYTLINVCSILYGQGPCQYPSDSSIPKSSFDPALSLITILGIFRPISTEKVIIILRVIKVYLFLSPTLETQYVLRRQFCLVNVYTVLMFLKRENCKGKVILFGENYVV